MKKKKNEVCPYCGCEEFVVGKQSGNAAVYAVDKVSFNGEILYHVFCVNCGVAIRSFIKNPKKLVLK